MIVEVYFTNMLLSFIKKKKEVCSKIYLELCDNEGEPSQSMHKGMGKFRESNKVNVLIEQTVILQINTRYIEKL